MSRTRTAQKSESAFRTISEVSDQLQIPQHVLRFWETKFAQVQPMKRGGGRRYYRPEDIELLRRIRDCLYADGYTIKGVQKLLREGQIAAELPPQVKAGRSAEGRGEADAEKSAPPPPVGHNGTTLHEGTAPAAETTAPDASTSADLACETADPPTAATGGESAAGAELSPQTRAVLEEIRRDLEAARAALSAATAADRQA